MSEKTVKLSCFIVSRPIIAVYKICFYSICLTILQVIF
ncbi:Uncharacterized protein dnm_062570 [Desulfonema magnum]|uniref:Uncharacterized protein n=1 Tax=Desulfonema magnum TaxID=45655 RepID=A0A975BR72_9BACT|nr:Uncharacterized protein dnm_062570 [Desulfonema magnum]